MEDKKSTKIVLPGDTITEITEEVQNEIQVKVGKGIMQIQNNFIATKPGILCVKQHKYWVETNQKRYVPSIEDSIIGIITQRRGEDFSVDIGSSSTASLSSMAFEAVTKKKSTKS